MKICFGIYIWERKTFRLNTAENYKTRNLYVGHFFHKSTVFTCNERRVNEYARVELETVHMLTNPIFKSNLLSEKDKFNAFQTARLALSKNSITRKNCNCHNSRCYPSSCPLF
jgi:ATP-dependent helicase/DNAse subunit B